MREVFRSNNPAELSWAQAMLEEAEVFFQIFDHHASLVEGSIGAIQQRVMVSEQDYERACQLLKPRL